MLKKNAKINIQRILSYITRIIVDNLNAIKIKACTIIGVLFLKTSQIKRI